MTDLISGQPLLEVRNLSVEFSGRRRTVRAVRDVSLTLAAGECLAVVGESGSGKSVTARALIGLAGKNATVRADRLVLDGTSLLGLGERGWRRIRGARIGFVLQDALTSLDPLRRVRDEVGEPLAIHRTVERAGRRTAVLSLLREVAIPDPEQRLDQHPHELSGGLRQRALIASAIAAQPELVVADEPTTALDVTIQAQILDLLAARKQRGTAVLLISHDLTVVARAADKIAVMYAGLIVEQGATEQVLNNPRHPYTVELLAAAPGLHPKTQLLSSGRAISTPASGPGCPYATRCVLADERCWAELPEAEPVPSGQLVRCWHPGQPAQTTVVSRMRVVHAGKRPVVVDVDAISKTYAMPNGGSRQAVSQVSFQLHTGEALGLVGESGSGKSTTAQIVLGMITPEEGEVRIDGQPWSRLREPQRRPQRHRIQVIYQDPLSSFDPRFTVERIIGEAVGRSGRRGVRANRARIVELLEQVGLDESYLSRRPHEMSGGQRQRVAIARALGPRPEVIVCDEPVSALDVSIQAQVLDLLTELQGSLGVALLFISHDLGVVRHVCDRVVVMKDGRIVEQGEAEAIFCAPEHEYTRELMNAVTATVGPPQPAALSPGALA